MLKWLPILALFVSLNNNISQVYGNPLNTSSRTSSITLSTRPYFPSAALQASNKNETRSVIYGMRAVGGSSEEGTLRIPAEKKTTLILFGQHLELANITFTRTPRSRGAECDSLDHTEVFTPLQINDGVYELQVILPPYSGSFFICTLNKDQRSWHHQGDYSYLQIGTKVPILPVWVSITLIFVLLSFSGLFSGLNLGLMSLDKNELLVIARCGTEDEKRYARTIAPIRSRGNYLLCSILLGNVFVNSTLTIIMDDLTSGLVAVICSTLAIVIFGEIVPQAACSRHGLAVGAKTIGITYFFMALTFPLSYPISKMLDFCLGDEIGHVYDRERLMEYIKVTKTYNKLEEDEVNIISGALCLKTKTVGEIMTRLEDVFMLPIAATLDFNTVSEISKKGYSRIPVFDGERKNVCALLHAKDLAFIDPDDNTPLRTVIEFYKHQLIHTYEDETLNNLLNHFRLGKSHMAFVRKIYATEDEDPYYEITGVVTLEDVIEEILQMEIVDETDILIDNRKKQRRKGAEHQDFTDFARIGAGPGTQNISSQMALATFQYLSTAVEPFKLAYLSETVLRRLIAQKIYYYVKNVKDNDARNIKERTIYTAGKPADYFIMILEGKTKVTVGSENLCFDAGPFTYFGTSALRLTASDIRNQSTASGSTRPPTPESPNFGSADIRMAIEANKLPQQPGAEANVTFRPDFSVVIVEPTLYMKVPRNVYIAAYRASLLEHQKGCPADEEKLQKEIDSAFNDNLLAQSPDLGRKDFHIAGEREKLLYESQARDGTSPHSERRSSSAQANQTSPAKRKNSLAALARIPIQAAAKLANSNSSSKAPNSPLSNYPPTLNLSTSKVNPIPDRKPTPPSQGPRAPSPNRINSNNRRNGSPKKDSPKRGSSPRRGSSPKRGSTPSPPGSPKEDSQLLSKSTTKPN